MLESTASSVQNSPRRDDQTYKQSASPSPLVTETQPNVIADGDNLDLLVAELDEK